MSDTVSFLTVRFDQCRTPKWTDAVPLFERMVCGAPTVPGRTYCPACREPLITPAIVNGRKVWIDGSAGKLPQQFVPDSDPDLPATEMRSARNDAMREGDHSAADAHSRHVASAPLSNSAEDAA